MSTATDIADSLKDFIAGHTLSQSFNCTRPARPHYSDTDTTLEVFIMPAEAAYDMASGTRGDIFVDHTVWVAIYNSIDLEDSDALQGMFDFVQEVIDVITAAPRGLSNYDGAGGNAQLVKIANAPVYDAGVLDANGVFLSMIAAAYRILR